MIKDLIEKYKELYPLDVVKQKGSWISINDSSFRAHEVQVMIDCPPKPEPIAEEPIDTEDDILSIASAIRMDGKHIFSSSNLRDMQAAGKRIAKMAKRIINIMEKK